ncbi:IclR family transcriptional regulator [Actinomadura alba]|uniref:IclR family transcriptional regulator n=1 Tax=Actinomadura alba TaxID=406431 RepID=A0ABR7LLS5_9ACTN|nr:IclR family transcriptional regulator [Actinomadura alba]MBC6465786.1 IclR family transcriptional regulator [Actinomadura alba]
MSGNAREPGRSTVHRLLTLLDVFDGTDLSLADVAERSQLPLTTAHRMLAALETWGGVERTPTGRYRIGLHLWKLGNRATSATTLRETALPLMQDLYESTHENVQLAIRDGHHALIIERLTGLRAVPTLTEVGGHLPLHATGVGKLLLAHVHPELLAELHARGLRRYTAYTLTMPGRLAASLATTRTTGIATAREEMTLGSASIAAPITDATGTVQAALSIVVHATTDLTRYTPALHTAAKEISRRLAATGGRVRSRSRLDRLSVASGHI